MSKTQTYKMLSGEQLEFPAPAPKVASFVARVVEALNDPTMNDSQMTDLIYGVENPLLRTDILPGHGVVTAESFANPVYQMMADMLGRKRAQVGVRAPAAREPMVTIAEAAKQHGVHPSAIRQAVAAGRLEGEKMGGTYFLKKAIVDSFHMTRRGPPGKHRLEVRMGSSPGVSFRVKVAGGTMRTVSAEQGGHIVEGRVERFDRVAVLSGGDGEHRYFELEPADTDAEVEFKGFFVRGKFAVTKKANNAQKAREAWKNFAQSAI